MIEWYDAVLGIDVTEYGLNFLKANELTLITYEQGEGETILNFTVDHLDEFIDELKSKSIEVFNIKEYDYGKFAQIKDPFNRIVELWQPIHDSYIGMVKKEIDEYKKNISL